MAYTVNQLISNAYYASGVVSREFETISGPEVADALAWLNDILQEATVGDDMIPYETTATFTSIVGQESYFIDNLIDADTLTFFYDDVRYPLKRTPRNQYFGNGRVETIQSLPYQWYLERGFGGATIYLYFLPNQPYTVEIHGIYRLTNVALGQDLELTLDRFFITYLRYALADRICAEYNLNVPMGVAKQLGKYQAIISKKSRPLDLRLRKNSDLHQEDRFGWAWVNLGRGYLP